MKQLSLSFALVSTISCLVMMLGRYDRILLRDASVLDTREQGRQLKRDFVPVATVASKIHWVEKSGGKIFNNTTITSELETERSLPSNTTSNTMDRVAASASSKNEPKYAYASLIAGCDPDTVSYRGFLYSVMVAAYILRQRGSTADYILMVQIQYESKHERLLEDEESVLRSLGIDLRYLPKNSHESFYDMVLEKFRILEWTEYSRVFFLDADIIPYDNLDYYFHLSEDGTLRENVVVAGTKEPANAGAFVLQPGEGRLDQLRNIVHERESQAVMKRETRKEGEDEMLFDPVYGWGHKIEAPDSWRTLRKIGRLWDFHCASSDQGLLYHWVKYHEKSASIVFLAHVENYYQTDSISPVSRQEILMRPFRSYQDYWIKSNLMYGFFHATGGQKPWRDPPPEDLTKETKWNSSTHLWWWSLHEINERYPKLGFNVTAGGATLKARTPLGNYARNTHLRARLQRKQEELQS